MNYKKDSDFKRIPLSNNNSYFLEIKTKNVNMNNCITLWCKKNRKKSNSLKINSKTKNCSLIYKLFYK